MNNTPTSTTNIDLQSDIGSKLVVHKNISQEIIIVNIDKLKLILQDHNKNIKRTTDWFNPLAIFLTLLLADLTATFNDFIGVSASVWNAIFLILTFAAAIYLIYNVYNCLQEGSTVEDIIEKIKAHHENSSTDISK